MNAGRGTGARDGPPAAGAAASADRGELQLLAELRRGRAEAFEQLMRRHNRLLFRAARGIVHDDAEAQDVLQEAYLKAFLALDRFRGESTLATWLTRIVLNQALMHLRKLGRQVQWDDDAFLEENDMPPTDGERAPWAELHSPEAEAERRQLRKQLEDAIDTLPLIYRTVFVLRAVQGLDLEETALALQVSQDVVKTRFLRARAMLRSHLVPGSEAQVRRLHEFDGRRCDEALAAVLRRLREKGVIWG